MSWFKSAIINAFDKALSAGLGKALVDALGADETQAILQRLRDAGLASRADNAKSSIPVSAEQLRNALGDDHLQQLARSLGIPVDQVIAMLANYLPHAATTTATGTSDEKATPT